MAKIQLSLLLLVTMGCVLMAPINAMDHTVGGSFGWNNPNNITFYQEWAKTRTFSVGDTLVFTYRTDMQNVLEVDEKDFNACTQHTGPINAYFNAPTIFKLTKPGNHYYYSSVGTHCEAGQKLSITVTDGPGSLGVQLDSIAPASGPTGPGNPQV